MKKNILAILCALPMLVRADLQPLEEGYMSSVTAQGGQKSRGCCNLTNRPILMPPAAMLRFFNVTMMTMCIAV